MSSKFDKHLPVRLEPTIAGTTPTGAPPDALSQAGPGLWRNVGIISWTAAFATTWYLFWAPVMPLIMRHLGATAQGTSMVFAVVNITTALAQYLGGRLADRVGVRRVIGWTGVALGLTWLGMALVAGSWQGLALFFVLGNILFGLQTTAFITVISDSVTPKRRLAAFSYYQLWSSLSFVAGPILGAFVVLPYLTTSCYLALTGGAYLAMGIVRLLWIREPRPLPTGTPPRVARPHAVRAVFLSPERRLLMVLTAGTTLVFALTMNGPFLALAARTLDHIPLRSIDFLFGLGAVGALIAGFVATRMGTAAKSLAFGLIGIAVAGAALAFPMSPPAVLGGYVLAFAGYQVATIAFSTLRVELAGTTNPGEVLGATSALAGLIAFLGLILGGALGSRLALLLASFCAASTALWAVRLVETGGTLRTAEGRPGYLSPTEDVSH